MSNEDDGANVPASATRGNGRRPGHESGTFVDRDGASATENAPAVGAPPAPIAGADCQAKDEANRHAGVDGVAGEAGASPAKQNRRRRRRRRRRGKPADAVLSPQSDDAVGLAIGAAPSEPVSSEEATGKTCETGTDDRPGRRRSRRPGRREPVVEPVEAARTVQPSPPTHTPRKGERKRSPRSRSSAWPGQRDRGRSNLYAALDLGTNNCRLLVATPRPRGDFRVVDAFSRIVRLGEGLASSGRLSDEAMERAVEALRVCASKLGSRPVRKLRLIATEACRRAENGEAFIAHVAEETGLELEIVDRETEARLAVSGCGVLVDRQAKGAVLFDIGGGSSELSLLDMRRVTKRNGRGRKKGRRPADAIAAWTSLPLGVVTLSEKHGGGRAVTRHVFENMVEEVMDLLQRFEGRGALRELTDEGDFHLLGTSGTVTTLAGVHLQLPRYDRRYVDGVWMRSADVDRTIDDLIDMGFDSRVANPCIGRDRADLVLAGCAILVAIQRMWPCERLRVADRGLREGILSELMHEDGAWRTARGQGRPAGQNQAQNQAQGRANGARNGG